MYPASMHIFFCHTVCYLHLQDIKAQSTNQSLVLLDEVRSFFFFSDPFIISNMLL